MKLPDRVVDAWKGSRKRVAAVYGWVSRKTRPLHSNIGARELLAALGLFFLWRGIGDTYGGGPAEIVVGSILVYAGMWHSLVVLLAFGAARRHK